MFGDWFTLVSFLPLSLSRWGLLEWKRLVKREEGAGFRTCGWVAREGCSGKYLTNLNHGWGVDGDDHLAPGSFQVPRLGRLDGLDILVHVFRIHGAAREGPIEPFRAFRVRWIADAAGILLRRVFVDACQNGQRSFSKALHISKSFSKAMGSMSKKS